MAAAARLKAIPAGAGRLSLRLLSITVSASLALAPGQAPAGDVSPRRNAAPGGNARVETADPALKGFDGFVQEVMRDWRVPGLAIAVVRKDRVLLLRGFGYRDVAKKLPVTPSTLMPIGSNTKAFTATVLGSLVDEGKLSWDEPVRSYLPDFRLSDEVAERLTTVRDLMSHRTGLPRHDAAYYGRSMTRETLYRRLRHLPFNRTFRQRWQYNNVTVTVAGMLAERIAGYSWEELVRSRILAPLGMTRSNLSIAALTHSDDFSVGYGDCRGAVTAVPYRDIEVVGPAGSINSSAEELIRFVQMQIRLGVYGGRRIFSEESSREVQYPQINLNRGAPQTRISDQDEGPDGLGPSGYGMGLSVTSYRGQRLLYHGGGIDGFISDMAWLPDAGIGVVVLTNYGDYNPVPTILERAVFDRLLGMSPVDWNARAKVKFESIVRQFGPSARKAAAPPTPPAVPSHPLEDYAGTYVDPGYGSIIITVGGGDLVAQVEGVGDPIRLKLAHHDSFMPALAPCSTLARWEGLQLTFLYGPDGRIDRLTIPLEGNVPAIVFKRGKR